MNKKVAKFSLQGIQLILEPKMDKAQLNVSCHSVPPYLLLLFDDMRQLCVGNTRIQLTLHQGGSLIVFDVAKVPALGDFDIFGEALEASQREKYLHSPEQINYNCALKKMVYDIHVLFSKL